MSEQLSREQFQVFLDHASEVVASWPEWKRNILNDSAKSTVSAPRQPVNNFEPARIPRVNRDPLNFANVDMQCGNIKRDKLSRP